MKIIRVVAALLMAFACVSLHILPLANNGVSMWDAPSEREELGVTLSNNTDKTSSAPITSYYNTPSTDVASSSTSTGPATGHSTSIRLTTPATGRQTSENTTPPMTTTSVRTEPITEATTTKKAPQTSAPITQTTAPVLTGATDKTTTQPKLTTSPITQGTTPSTKAERTPITEEIRAVWVATVFCLDYPSAKRLDAEELKKELEELVDNSFDLGFNAIYFQVRPTGDALYPSEIFPSSHWITGTQGAPFPDDFDILGYLISYAHSKDVAVHAWINPYRVTNASSMELSDDNPARVHPEWTFEINGLVYYNPGMPEVSELIADGVEEIVRNYDIDGIVFDDYFYPDEDEFHHSKPSKDIDYQLYLQYGKDYNSIGDWRRANINNMISTVFARIKGVNSECLFGVAPAGIWNNKSEEFPEGSNSSGRQVYSAIFCDALAWANGKYVDYISPQIYWTTTNTKAPFKELALWWQNALSESGTPLIISYNAYSISAQQTQIQIDFARQMDNYYGYVMYNYNNILSSESRKEIITGLGAFVISKEDE